MLDPASPAAAGCTCPLCRRAAPLEDASARAPERDPLGTARGIARGAALGGAFWLVVAVAVALWLLARQS